MSELFNTPFETGMRVLLVLYAIKPRGATIDRITAYDFMSTYGRDFGITDFNLHGNNTFNFSELPSKRSLINKGIIDAALDGMIVVNQASSGFQYKLSRTGIAFVESLNTNYSQQYLEAISKIHQAYSRKSDATIMKEINTKAITTLRR